MPNYMGISYPFSITGGGGVATSELTYSDINRIKESIEQILLTYPGERVMEPTFGCRLRDFVFENVDDPGIRGMIKYEIENAVLMWEKRAEVRDIVISSVDTDSERYLFIDIYIYVPQYQYESNMQVTVTP